MASYPPPYYSDPYGPYDPYARSGYYSYSGGAEEYLEGDRVSPSRRSGGSYVAAPPPPPSYYYPPPPPPYFGESPTDADERSEEGTAPPVAPPGYYHPQPWMEDRRGPYGPPPWDETVGRRLPPGAAAGAPPLPPYPYGYPPPHPGDPASFYPPPYYVRYGDEPAPPAPSRTFEEDDDEDGTKSPPSSSIRRQAVDGERESHDDHETTSEEGERQKSHDDQDPKSDETASEEKQKPLDQQDDDPLALLAKVSSDQSEVPNKTRAFPEHKKRPIVLSEATQADEKSESFDDSRDEGDQRPTLPVPKPITPVSATGSGGPLAKSMESSSPEKPQPVFYPEFTNYAPPSRYAGYRPRSYHPHHHDYLTPSSVSTASYPAVVEQHGSFDSHSTVGSSSRGGRGGVPRRARHYYHGPPPPSGYPDHSQLYGPPSPPYSAIRSGYAPYPHPPPPYGSSPPPSWPTPPMSTARGAHDDAKQPWGEPPPSSATKSDDEAPLQPPDAFTPPRSDIPSAPSQSADVATATAADTPPGKPAYSPPKVMYPRPTTLATSSFPYAYPPGPYSSYYVPRGPPPPVAALPAPETTVLRKKFSWKHYPEVSVSIVCIARFRLIADSSFPLSC
jgi:hypothetical protein